MIDYQWTAFPTIGYIKAKLTEESLLPVINEINLLKNNKSLSNDRIANKSLAGQIKQEYDLIDSKPYLENLILPYIKGFDNTFKYGKSVDVLTKNLPIKLHTAWVNFQEKYEHNPLHNHSGIYSFVIWKTIPYDIELEKNLHPGKNSEGCTAGIFEFVYSNTVGGIYTQRIEVSKKDENTLLVFPAKLFHQVYPFYTSNDIRVSISGNFAYDASKI